MSFAKDLERELRKLERKKAKRRQEFIDSRPNEFDKMVTRSLFENYDAIQKRALELTFGYGVPPEQAVKQARAELEKSRSDGQS